MKMYKTIWFVKDEKENKTLYSYHFGATPHFPSRFMKENNVYEVEMAWNINLMHKFKIFLKCLFNYYFIITQE